VQPKLNSILKTFSFTAAPAPNSIAKTAQPEVGSTKNTIVLKRKDLFADPTQFKRLSKITKKVLKKPSSKTNFTLSIKQLQVAKTSILMLR